MTITEKLTALRAELRAKKIAAYYISDVDPHQSEYVADYWQGRSWLSGFDGSAGTLVVTLEEAALWTDSRYFIQGEQQLKGTGIELMRQGEPNVPSIGAWLTAKLQAGDVVACDGNVIAVNAANNLEKRLHEVDLRIEYSYDLLENVWLDRPALPSSTPFEHPANFVAESRTEKLQRLQDFMRREGLAHYLVVGLDEIAWLLNVRGKDVDFNPLVLSYLLVTPKSATWFCGAKRVTEDLKVTLQKDNIQLADYQYLQACLQHINAIDESIGMDTNLASVKVYHAAGSERVQKVASPIPQWKSIKAVLEVDHIRNAMARDGVALLKLRRWLDTEEAKMTNEVAISDYLTARRAEQANYFGDSFPAIVGYRGNGAIVHYRAVADNCATLDGDGMLLLDSGGQYFDGTTDITRTFHLGTPTQQEKFHFTLVLQGHIDLAMAKFPQGTVGRQLDTLARNPLWQHALNYGHGTGHGVGYFLNVHEGPMGIRGNYAKSSSKEALCAGQILSNEPGYYLTDQYGIRIENLVVVKQGKQAGWLEFEDLTVFPMERKLIDFDMLTAKQVQWLKSYHEKVEAAIKPLLTDADEIAWLEEACRAW